MNGEAVKKRKKMSDKAEADVQSSDDDDMPLANSVNRNRNNKMIIDDSDSD